MTISSPNIISPVMKDPVKDALLLINMGGPDDLSQVQPYLRAIFRDPAILPMPGLFRAPLAAWISSRRTEKVQDRYRLIGGRSPLHHWTDRLRAEVEKALRESGSDMQVDYAFRYTAPFIPEAIASLKRAGIENVLALPLFPHYTKAMTGSVLREVERAAFETQLHWHSIDAWGLHETVLDLWKKYLLRSVDLAGENARVLFVAHGIPLRSVRQGEDYPDRVMDSARSLGQALPEGTQWSLAFQSRVGPVEWTGPYLEPEIQRLAQSSDPLVIMPLSFVADCLETLYDLDRVAMDQARAAGIETVVRVRVFNDDPCFAKILAGLAAEVQHAV
jgi:ferrochelatase